ncbi:hypothetical protein NDU88_008534 [Pleurodeles waltl]|uniref:Uncharacterized protein n=1 Tax=Pleurodeles waltl TaxID=8319 RepID=A0AAV7PPK6_PLEWA|nr:hypothetical protein NDU88_008534 [Pleurodeles waltl]
MSESTNVLTDVENDERMDGRVKCGKVEGCKNGGPMERGRGQDGGVSGRVFAISVTPGPPAQRGAAGRPGRPEERSGECPQVRGSGTSGPSSPGPHSVPAGVERSGFGRVERASGDLRGPVVPVEVLIEWLAAAAAGGGDLSLEAVTRDGPREFGLQRLGQPFWSRESVEGPW